MTHLTLKDFYIGSCCYRDGGIRMPQAVRCQPLDIFQSGELHGFPPNSSTPVVIVDMSSFDGSEHVSCLRLFFDELA